MIERKKVEVSDEETEIIEPIETDKEKYRVFVVENGNNEIETKAWGSNDGENWVEKSSLVIPANNPGSLTVGIHSYWVKLTGKTTESGKTNIVDAYLFW